MAEPLNRRLHRCAASTGVGDVGLHHERGPAETADLTAGGLQLGPPPGGQHHIGPGLGQRHGEARPKATAGPRDQRHLPGQRETLEHGNVWLTDGTTSLSSSGAPGTLRALVLRGLTGAGVSGVAGEGLKPAMVLSCEDWLEV
jgi:hypothetical protein